MKKFLNLLLSSAVLAIFSQLITQPAIAVWTFDASSPRSVVNTFKTSTDNEFTIRTDIYEDDDFSFENNTGKTLYIYFNSQNQPPTQSFSTLASNFNSYKCQGSTINLKQPNGSFGYCYLSVDGPLLKLISNYTLSTSGYQKATSTTGNIALDPQLPTYYIYSAVNQDNAGNSGLWSSTSANSTVATTPIPNTNPFIQTQQGDVHSNKSINPKR